MEMHPLMPDTGGRNQFQRVESDGFDGKNECINIHDGDLTPCWVRDMPCKMISFE